MIGRRRAYGEAACARHSFIHSFVRLLARQALLAAWHVPEESLPLLRACPRASAQAAPEGQRLGCFAHCHPWCWAHTAQTQFMTTNEWAGSFHEEDAMITPVL